MVDDDGRAYENVGRVPPRAIDRLGDESGARAGLLVLVQALVVELAVTRGESVPDTARRLKQTCRQAIIEHFTGDEAEYATFTRAPIATRFIDDVLSDLAEELPSDIGR